MLRRYILGVTQQRNDYQEATIEMFSSLNVPYDIIFFALLTALLIWRLRSVLGRHANVDVRSPRAHAVPVVTAGARARPPVGEESDVSFDLPGPATRLGQVLSELASVHQGFRPDVFLRNAEKIFRDVVYAFAKADRPSLRRHLTHDAFATFDSAIAAREAARQTQLTDIKGILSLAIVDAVVGDKAASVKPAIDVQIVSRQISVLKNQNGQPEVGTEAVTEFSDLWRFVYDHPIEAESSGWRLAAAQAG